MRSFLTFVIFTAAPLVALSADITLLETASVIPGELVRLRDVATITGADAERVAEAPLMPSPAPGTSQYLSAGAVRDLLAAQGEAPRGHRYRGAYRVQVMTTTGLPASPQAADDSEWRPVGSSGAAFRVRGGFDRQPIGVRTTSPRRPNVREVKAVEQAVAAAVQQALDARLATSDGPRLVVRSVELSATAIQELSIHEGQPLTAAFGETITPTSGAVQARLWPSAKLDDEPFLVVADLIAQPMRLVVVAPLSRGSMITTSAVRVEPTPVEEIGRPQATGYTKLEEAVGREATRSLRAGEVLSDANTAPPVMVRRGEESTVVSGGGGVSVSMRVVATQEGRLGDLVTVETIDRDERFPARVVGPRRLAVLSAGPALADTARLGGLQ